jgi:hypothetical protein
MRHLQKHDRAQMSLWPDPVFEGRGRRYRDPPDRSPEYHLAMRSRHWSRTKAKALAQAGYRCSNCGAPTGLLVLQNHHETGYSTLGYEMASQVPPLCKLCHSARHRSGSADE